MRQVGKVTLEVRSLRRVQEFPAAAESSVVDVVICGLVLFGVPCPGWDVPQSVHAFITILKREEREEEFLTTFNKMLQNANIRYVNTYINTY